MEEQEESYVHRVVEGLPRSLLAIDGKTFAAIALMQRYAGLTRDRRRKLQDGVKVGPRALVGVSREAPKTERTILTHYLNPGCRSGNFWAVVRELTEPTGSAGAQTYALAIDLQLLKAYEPDCLNGVLDEAALSLACPEWASIRKRLEGAVRPIIKSPPLGLFMLWTRLVADLSRWSTLDADLRTKVGHAIFALSSVGWTSWFIDKALKIRPELDAELGALVAESGQDNHAAEVTNGLPHVEKESIVSTENQSVNSASGNPVDPANGQTWSALLQRLDELVAELKGHPNREAVSDLATLAAELEMHGSMLPSRKQPEAIRVDACIADLVTHLRALPGREGLDWFDEDLVAQIEARWKLATSESGDPVQLGKLADDALAATQRSSDIAATFLQALDAANASRKAVATIEDELAKAKGFAEQAACKRRRTEALKHQIDADSTLQARQEQLIDAASPFGEPFDYTQDYRALLWGRTAQSGGVADESTGQVQDASQPQVVEDVAPIATATPDGTTHRAAKLVGEVQPAPTPEASPMVESAAAAAQVFDQTALPTPPSETVASRSSPQPANELAAEGPDPYNDAAGEACRPIWQLLANGQPALAFHAANWIGAASPGTKVPSPDLLAASALAGALTLPDGGVQAALSARFERLDPLQFATDTPRAWHAAVNLLLASATLRPMIIAPNTGAGTIAAYLHQDGRYPALYALVQQLRELSPLLMGFRIEPAVLRQARGEAAIRADLQALQHTAEDWLRVQAPAYTIKFAAATGVWRQWLRAGGQIDNLVAPVVHNRVADVERVREQMAAMSDHDHVQRLIRDTDRKTLNRRRGEDIHAGALDHLLRCVDEALRLPRQWISLVDLLGRHGDRLREVLEQVHTNLRESRRAVEDELLRAADHDPWGLIQAGQAQALSAMRAVLALFDSTTDLPVTEPSAADVVGRPLLLIPDLPVSEDWTVEAAPAAALLSVTHWLSQPVSPEGALQQRLERGDLLGADMLQLAEMSDPPSAHFRQERERWRQALRKEIAECRRSVEVGSAYGYLPDADRGQIESRLALWEAQLEDVRRFDVAMAELQGIRARVTEARGARAEQVREAMRGIAVTGEMQAAVAEIEKALAEGDIATANELVHWLAQGRPAPAELDQEDGEGFNKFFPTAMQAIESWLEGQRRDAIELAIRQGQSIPGVDVHRIAGAQRDQAAKMFGAWLDMKTHQGAEQSRLEPLLTGLGFTVKALQRAEKVAGREVWTLDVLPVEDRHICPIPLFGSGASGKYRVVCVWGRPTEDELLQWVGDSAASRPALLFYFGRMTERKWRDLSRLAKTKRRSFVMLDETLLAYICCTSGSRLQTWLDAALPFSFSSPYDATAGLVPPEMFYGRGVELDAVRGLNGRCFIYGGRQLGKTALLKRAEQSFHAPGREHYAKWIDLRAEGIGVSRAAGEMWITLHEKLKELHVLDARLAAPIPGKKQGVEGVIRAIRDFLTSDTDRRVLLLLDEADRFFEQDGRNDFEETRRLKQLMDETGRRFKVVFAGLHNVLRMTERPNHPLAHFGEPIEIGPLREGEEVREAADLIRRPMAAAGFDFESRGLVIRILAQTNYYPSLIQLYCSHLLRHMLGQVANRQRPNGPRYLVTDRDIEQVYSSDALRDEIRAKFRLTLQLDPRYEVVAYAMALDLLRNRYSQSDGMPWQTIRQSGAMHWWPVGFRDTSELDFRVLLDEMVGLGVLRRVPGGRYVLRNPNVLLLLGTQEEIEAVLIKDREPAVEFESASFRPPLRQSPSSALRNVFTYQQLSKLLQRTNNVTIVAGTATAGIDRVVASLEDYLGKEATPVVLTNCTDRQSFGNALAEALIDREKDLVTAFVVPDSLPWTALWLAEAQQRLKRLQSGSKFASIVFVAEPATLWRLLGDELNGEDEQPPWMSLLHWRDEFLRHWLDERQLQLDAEDRRRLGEATGYWPTLLMDLAGDCTELRTLRERLATASGRWFERPDLAALWRSRLGLDVAEPRMVIEVLARLGEPVDSNELALVAELPIRRVKNSLRWGELLGLTRSEGADFWTVDPIASLALVGTSR